MILLLKCDNKVHGERCSQACLRLSGSGSYKYDLLVKIVLNVIAPQKFDKMTFEVFFF